MRPTSDTIIQRPDLGQAVYETMQAAPTVGYIGLQVMAPFYVAENTAEYPVIPKEALFNLLDTRRGPLGHYNRGTEDFESGYYKTAENGLERRVDDRYAKIYGSKFNYELTISNILMNNILRAQEFRVANKLFDETNFKAAIAAGTAWATVASASPKTDVDKGKDELRKDGVIPNALVFNYTNYLYLTRNSEIRDEVEKRFPDTAKTGNITLDHLRAYFDIPQILVAGALVNTKEMGQDAELSDLWSSTYALLCKVAPGAGADVTEPTIGRTFIWNEGAAQEVIVEEYYDNTVRSNILRVRHDTSETYLASYDENNAVKSEISKACGYLIDVTGS